MVKDVCLNDDFIKATRKIKEIFLKSLPLISHIYVMITSIFNKHNPVDTKLTTIYLNKYFIGWQRYTHDGGNTGKRGPNPGKAF